MPTLKDYSYAFRDFTVHRGVQTLRGSHQILPIEPVSVKRGQRQLLMDWHILDDLNGCHRTVHSPSKFEGNPVIQAQEPFESAGPASFGTVLRDDETGLWRMWTIVKDVELMRTSGKVLGAKRGHYYESDDGISWRRPKLGLYDYKGSKENNIFLTGFVDHLYVWPLPDRLRERGRLAMMFFNNDWPQRDPSRLHPNGHGIAYSDDGVHWTEAPQNPIWYGRSDCNNCITYNPERDVFMMYRRATINAGEIRRIAYSQSEDLLSWSQPVNIIHREETDDFNLYSMPVSRYNGVYFGYLQRLHSHAHWKSQALDNGMDFRMDTELAWSRDGVRWERHPQRPAFIPVSPPHDEALDWGMAQGMGNIIDMGDKIRVYWGGKAHPHAPGYRPSERHTIHMGTLRKDGFVSVNAGGDGGYMLTRPLLYPGGKLHINARAHERGFIRVGVREGHGIRDGEWQEDWRFESSRPFTGDSLDAVMTWESHDTLATFPSQILRLHFWMENAELYSFWFD